MVKNMLLFIRINTGRLITRSDLYFRIFCMVLSIYFIINIIIILTSCIIFYKSHPVSISSFCWGTILQNVKITIFGANVPDFLNAGIFYQFPKNHIPMVNICKKGGGVAGMAFTVSKMQLVASRLQANRNCYGCDIRGFNQE